MPENIYYTIKFYYANFENVDYSCIYLKFPHKFLSKCSFTAKLNYRDRNIQRNPGWVFLAFLENIKHSHQSLNIFRAFIDPNLYLFNAESVIKHTYHTLASHYALGSFHFLAIRIDAEVNKQANQTRFFLISEYPKSQNMYFRSWNQRQGYASNRLR